jgi:putative transcriptional regulator
MRTRIKELRARDGLTQADLAKQVGVRRETISFVENGEYNPSLLLAKRIAFVFEETIEEIFIFDEDELALD